MKTIKSTTTKSASGGMLAHTVVLRERESHTDDLGQTKYVVHDRYDDPSGQIPSGHANGFYTNSLDEAEKDFEQRKNALGLTELSTEEKEIFENPEKCPYCAEELDYVDPEIDTDDKQSIKHDRDCQGCGATFCLTYTLSSVDIEEPTWQEHFMSDDATFESFLGIFEGGKAELKEKYQSDSIMWSEDWNCYTDNLCKEGKISGKQYHHMAALNEFLGIQE